MPISVLLPLLALQQGALACNEGVLSAVKPASPGAVGEVEVVSGTYAKDGLDLAGAVVSFASAASIPRWREVLLKPEDQEEWQDRSLGMKRAERLDPDHTFMATDLQMLWGAVRIERQMLVEIHWKDKGDQHLQNCWQAVAPEPWLGRVAPWVEPSVEWIRVGFGGWNVVPRPEGGTLVTYQFWTQSDTMLPSIQGWAMSRTLPDLMKAFEAHLQK